LNTSSTTTALGERRFRRPEIVRGDLRGMPAIDADEAQRPVGQARQRGAAELHRVALVQHQSPAVGMAFQIAPEPREVAAARLVDVEMLMLEQVDRNRLLAVAAEQVEQDEELAVMHADLGNAALDAQRALPFGQRHHGPRRLAAQPSVNVELAAPDVLLDPWIHGSEARPRRPGGQRRGNDRSVIAVTRGRRSHSRW
jgi:hypothetical protein